MIGKPSHVKELALSHLCKIGLKTKIQIFVQLIKRPRGLVNIIQILSDKAFQINAGPCNRSRPNMTSVTLTFMPTVVLAQTISQISQPLPAKVLPAFNTKTVFPEYSSWVSDAFLITKSVKRFLLGRAFYWILPPNHPTCCTCTQQPPQGKVGLFLQY